MKNKPEERLYYLDGLRGFLIILVVLLHSSRVYSPSQSWLIYSQNNSVVIDYLMSLLSLLCMPTFFMIAGYFAVISFKHSHSNGFLSKRISRLLIPLVTIALTLNILQAYILVAFGWKDYNIGQYISNGDWIQHLWFIINLIVYTVISYIFIRYCKVQTRKTLIYVSKKLVATSLYGILFFLPLLSIGLMVIMQIIPSFFLGINISSIILEMPYYLFGILLFSNKNLLNKFSSISVLVSVIMIALSLVIVKNIKGIDVIYFKLAYYYFNVLGTWFLASFVFTIFRKHLNRKSRLIFNISDASYTIYLLHHVLVIAIGIILIKLNIGTMVGLLILFVSSVLLSYIIHRKVILRNSLFKLLINGQKSKK